MSGSASHLPPFRSRARSNIPLVSWWVSQRESSPPLPVCDHESPFRRSIGRYAQFAVLEARAQAYEGKSEFDLAATCWAELARGYLFRKSRHDMAIRCARRSLELKDDPVLRDELATWLEGIGCWSEAAGVLTSAEEPSALPERVRFHRRAASLWWRSGQTELTTRVLAEIARIDAESTEPLEWLAALHTSAPAVVSRERAVLAQLEAARRYQQQGARLAAFEAELRAFEIDPGSALATEPLAISLTNLGRREASEDVWRECARVANTPGLYRQQIDKALARDEHDRALATSLDALEDKVVEVDSANQACEYALNPVGPVPRTFDGVLARARIFGWLAARFEIALVENATLRHANPWIILTRLFASAMGMPELAVESLARGMLSDPKSVELRRLLKASVNEAGDSDLLLCSLVNAARAAKASDLKLWLANEFVERQGRGLDAPSLISWALCARQRESLAGSIDSDTVVNWQQRMRKEHDEWQNLLAESRAKPTAQRIQVLERVAGKMALDPTAIEGLRDVLLEWLEQSPGAATALAQLSGLVEAFAQNNDADELTSLWQLAFDTLTQQGGERGCLAVVGYWLRRGRPVEALVTIRPAIDNPEPSQRLLGWVTTLARRMVDKRLYADAVVLMSKTTETAISALLLAQAAEVYVELGEIEIARRVVEGALSVSPKSARLLNVDVILQSPDDPRSLAETLERALGVIPLRAAFALQLADAHEKLGNLELALAWAQRASTLLPGAAPLRSKVAHLAVLAGDAGRMTDWLVSSIDAPFAISDLLPTATTVLAALTKLDASRAVETSRRLMTALGASDAAWRATLLSSADSVSDARLALDVLERAVASGADLANVLGEIVRRRLQLGDLEAAFEAALRALRVGVSPATVRSWVPNLFEADYYEVPDTELAAAELVRELCLTDVDQDVKTQALRRLAADRFVLANDEVSALFLWSELLQSDYRDTIEAVADDLAQSLGHRAAVRQLLNSCEQASTPQRRCRLYAAAASLLVQIGDVQLARECASQSIGLDPSNLKPLFVAEALVENETEQDWLDGLYDTIARSTLGSYGERALHYRAAKIFERLGGFARALRHACVALVAVPSECVTLRLAAALTRHVGDTRPFVDAILTIVTQAQLEQDAARWLTLAQDELATRAEFLDARVELLLYALASEPAASLVSQATEAVLRLAIGSAGAGEVARSRLTQLLRVKLEQLQGPSGARLALSTAAAAVRLEDANLSALAFGCALRCDAAIDEYEQIESTIHWLCTGRDRARDMLLDALAVLEMPYVNVGTGALKAVGRLQLEGGDASSWARLDGLADRVGGGEAYLEWMGTLLPGLEKNSPGSLCVVQQLAQLRVSQGRLDEAIQLLQVAIKRHARSPIAHDGALSGVAILLEHRSLANAHQWVQSIREDLSPVDAASIELQLARMTGDTLHLVQALAHRAYSDPTAPLEGVAFLVEATELAERLGDEEAALECARAAVKWDANQVGAQSKLAELVQKANRGHGLDAQHSTPNTASVTGGGGAPGPVDEESLEIPLVRRRSGQPSDAPQAALAIDQALISPESDPETLGEAIERAGFMAANTSSSYQTLTLLRRWLRRWPSSACLMEFVRDAAFVERDIPLSRAVEHARGVLLGFSERVAPPDLSAQPIVPEDVRALLMRDISTSVSDALALIWEGGEHFLQRDLTEYGVTGLDRITSSSTNLLGQTVADVAPRLGLLRTPLFHKRGAPQLKITVALSNPTALLVDGELPRDARELTGSIAGALWVTQPEYSLMMGASVVQVNTVLVALKLAFGPPQRNPPTNLGEALRLAEKLWECIPSAAQRRLRDLCLESLDYDRALQCARRAQRRAALYATGDLKWSLDQLSRDEDRDVFSTIADPEVGDNAPDAADLLRLATSAEHAAIRWQPSKGSEQRIPLLQS